MVMEKKVFSFQKLFIDGTTLYCVNMKNTNTETFELLCY